MRIGTTLRLAIAPTIPHMCSTLFLFFRPRPPGNGRLLYPRERELSGRGVLGERGSGADRDVSSDLAVADIGEVIGFGALPDAARLDLDEVAEVHVGGEARARPDAGVGADAAVRADVGLLDVAERLDRRAGRDPHVLQYAICADCDLVAEPHVTLEDAVDVNRDVTAAAEVPAHITARGVGDAHALLQKRLDRIALVDAFKLRELAAAVDAERFPRGIGLRRRHGDPFARRERDDIGQVILLLGVLVFQPDEPVFQLLGRGHDDTGVDFVQGALARAGVFFLDDACDAAAAAYDAAVPGGVIKRRRKQTQPLAGRFGQAAQRFGANQRDV